jgi:hypothetical protein
MHSPQPFQPAVALVAIGPKPTRCPAPASPGPPTSDPLHPPLGSLVAGSVLFLDSHSSMAARSYERLLPGGMAASATGLRMMALVMGHLKEGSTAGAAAGAGGRRTTFLGG